MTPTFKFILGVVITVCTIVSIAMSQYGCAVHEALYKGLDARDKPYTIELSAKRFIMGQEVQGFSATFPGGYKVGFDSSKGDPTKVMENFFGVLGPILQEYISNQPRSPGQ